MLVNECNVLCAHVQFLVHHQEELQWQLLIQQH